MKHIRWSLMLAANWLMFIGVSLGTEPDQSDAMEIQETPITESDREHWAFRPIVRPELPVVSLAAWPTSPVDYFILEKLDSAGLSPAPPAQRASWLRRIKFGMLGLPPTPEEVVEFEQDERFDVYERIVDAWLASPAYGERWAQHWLDLARFAETDGFEHDKVRPDAWKYRQWVIDALNDDMPYDQFVRCQLAGDENGDASDAIATMFCLAGPDMPDINEQDLRRHDKLNEITSTVGASLLGLQMHCAQCHDHKYDPISLADFYRLRAVFESAIPLMQRDKPVFGLAAQEETTLARVYFRGELRQAGPAVRPRPPRIANPVGISTDFDQQNPRQAFVEWMFRDDNPLASRVIVNRIWQHHFGTSLCENPSDFGFVAQEPLHTDLLDWLADELRNNNWSLKHLHRTILLSATYRQASHPEGEAADWEAWRQSLEEDPVNELYSRFPRQRLEGELIRDAMLAISGQLVLQQGGPSVFPPLPAELLQTLLKDQWRASEQPADHVRRSIYVFARRNLRYPIFDVFDRPDAGATCAQRDRSTTAIQSLQMLNSDLAFRAAVDLRNRLLAECAPSGVGSAVDLRRLVTRLFRITLARAPHPEEARRIFQLLDSEPSQLDANLLTVCVAMLNTSEFIYLD